MKIPVSIAECRDCMPAMAEFPDGYFHLAVVDPPYGSDDAIGLVNGKSHLSNRGGYKVFKNIAPDSQYFNELFRISRKWIVWGGNFFGLAGGVIAWNKKQTVFGEGEVAICNTHKSVVFFEHTWNGMLQQDMANKEHRIHPTQKPVALYKWLLQNYAKPGDRILDTHLGSGSSRIAAWDMGFDFWGYEIDKDYFDSSEARFKTHISKPVLFSADEMYRPEQTKLFEE